jgi:hypothetical protein
MISHLRDNLGKQSMKVAHSADRVIKLASPRPAL